MKSKQLPGTEQKSYVLIFNSGDEVMAGLTSFARDKHLTAGHLTGIGAFSTVALGYFDWESKRYLPIEVNEQVEVVSLIGDVAMEKGEPKIHAHMAVAKRGGVMVGGHLLAGHVRPTLEVVLMESPAHLQRQFDPESGIALIRL